MLFSVGEVLWTSVLGELQSHGRSKIYWTTILQGMCSSQRKSYTLGCHLFHYS